MVSGDPVVKKVLPGFDKEVFYLCECNGNFLNIIINCDHVVKEALTVGVYREQAWTPCLLPFLSEVVIS